MALACSARASGLSADSARICTEPSQAGLSQATGDSSRTAWKFEPPKPKALTPARRGKPLTGLNQGRAREGRWKGEPGSSRAAWGFWALSVGGITPWRKARAAFSRPAAPAAPLA